MPDRRTLAGWRSHPRLPAALQRLGFVPAPRGNRRTWLDVLFVLWLWFGFDAINNLAPVRQQAAEAHARGVLAFEQSLHLAPEHALNLWLATHHLARDVTVWWYYNVHAIVTFGVFFWVWWRRPPLVPRMRWAMVLANLVALAVFWSWPVAPPRMLVTDGYRDLVSLTFGQPVWHAGDVAVQSNQLAAFPSLHIAWAVWAAVGLWLLCRRRWARALIVAYPFVTLFAVMATGNHYLVDGVAGALLMALAFLATDRLIALAGARRPAPSLRAPSLAPEGAGDG
jgi:membrane-associated phospholipid phosphatase